MAKTAAEILKKLETAGAYVYTDELNALCQAVRALVEAGRKLNIAFRDTPLIAICSELRWV